MKNDASGESKNHRVPMLEIMGQLYHKKLTGRLSVFTPSQPNRPVYSFWFKRGFPCFSQSAQGVARLGEALEAPARPRLQHWFKRNSKAGADDLVGQRLLSSNLITLDELQQALKKQLETRLLSCGAITRLDYRFEEGMDVFGAVPLSSPVLNPLELASRMAQVVPLEEVQHYAQRKIRSPRLVLAQERGIPEPVRKHLSDALLEELQHPTALELSQLAPSRLRTLVFLAAFRFLQGSHPPPDSHPQPRPSMMNHDRSVAHLAYSIREGATWYELLGIRFTATASEIKRRYRELAFDIHPDRLPHEDSSAAREVFGLMVEAYQTLSRERTRVVYDMEITRNGKWKRLGALPRFLEALKTREQSLVLAGQHELAMEYQRMASAARTPVPRAGTDLSEPVGTWQTA